MKRSLFLISIFLAFISITFTLRPAVADEYLYLDELDNFYLMPKTLDLREGTLWSYDYRDNPALLGVAGPSEFIMDLYYFGSAMKNSTEGIRAMYNVDNAGTGFGYDTVGYCAASVDEKYFVNRVGSDIGFSLAPTDRSRFALILDYDYTNVDGNGSSNSNYAYSISTGYFSSSINRGVSTHDVGLSALYDLDITDALSVGIGLKYTFTHRYFSNEVSGSGIQTVVTDTTPESTLIDDGLTFRTHRISPVFGISIHPLDALTINSSLTTRFSFGTVHKESFRFDDYWASLSIPGWTGIAFPTSTYTEDLNSGRVFDWGVDYVLDAQYRLDDAVSVPFDFEFSYDHGHWDADGISSGYFAPQINGYFFLGPGTIEYNNDQAVWKLMIGSGITYKTDGYNLSAKAYYSHWDLSDEYGQHNDVVSSITIDAAGGGTVPLAGLSSYTEKSREMREVLSLELAVSKEFSKALTADFTVRYDVGWGHMNLQQFYMSPYEYYPPNAVLKVDITGRDVFQDLTLYADLFYSPTEHLKLGFAGMVKIPIDSINYDLGGNSSGVSTTDILWNRNLYLDGPASTDYNSRTWDYGAMFSASYEF
jgi:hypothetical protein